MKTISQLAALLLSSTLTFGASAEALHGPLQGNTLQLSGHAVSIYYTEKGDDFEVVTTVGANANHDYVFRFTTELSDNEQHSVTIGGYSDNEANTTLTLSRVGNEITADIQPKAVPAQQKLTMNFQ